MSKNELKNQRLKENIDERASKDAQFLWKDLTQRFLANPKDPTSIIANLTIKVCFCEKSQDLLHYADNRVFIMHGSASKCLLFNAKKIRYPKETSALLQQLAVNDGFTVCNQGYSEIPHFDNFFEYALGPIYGEWISFTAKK